MYFSPQISTAALLLLLFTFVCVLLLAAFYFYRVRRVVNYRRRADNERRDKSDAEYVPASVVVYSQGDAEALESMLKVLLNQEYPAAYEVVVVNEGESSDIRDTVAMLRAGHNNLYLTFTPEGVVNLSRKKLALTLGIKAARYDVVVLTTTAATIESPLWLRRMMRQFGKDGGADIVLGFAYVEPGEDDAMGRRRRAFDYVADSVRWLGAAVAGNPFRGTEYNIAYRKKAFLDNKGFSRSLNLHYGDDDIFVSEIVRGRKVAVELSEESMVRLNHGNHPRVFTERMLRRVFTESFIRRRPRFLMPAMGWLQITAVISAATAAAMEYPNMQAAVAAAALLLLMCAVDIIAWYPAHKALKSRPLRFTLPWFTITYPLRRIGRGIRSRLSKQKKYTWT